MADFDVMIAGAGPAGCAAALSLADFAPELRVCLAEVPPLHGIRVGETVPPQIKPLLDHLRLWPMFAAGGHCASYRTVSAWGGPQLASNEFLFHTQQVGWRIDRARFDAMMLQAAAGRTATHRRAKVADLTFADDRWHGRFDDGEPLTARFVVDATGRAAALARSQGGRSVNLDRLVGCFVFFDGVAGDGEGLMIESGPDGWWYSAAIPDDRRVVAFMSDGDLVRSLGVGELDGWLRALMATRYVRSTVSHARPLGPPQLQPASSQYRAGNASSRLLCVGDAASCFDPVSGQGIVKALRSGIFASYAIADCLRRADESGIARYRSFVKDEFSAYRTTLRDYYAMEQRWPDRPFWQRRHAAGRQDPQPSQPASAAYAASP